jgi:hypothetical protein
LLVFQVFDWIWCTPRVWRYKRLKNNNFAWKFLFFTMIRVLDIKISWYHNKLKKKCTKRRNNRNQSCWSWIRISCRLTRNQVALSHLGQATPLVVWKELAQSIWSQVVPLSCPEQYLPVFGLKAFSSVFL